MLVAISQRNEKHEVYGYRDILENNYINYFEQFGIKLFPVSNSSKNLGEYFSELNLNGIILTGGGDVNPKLYKQKPRYATNFSELRDNTEGSLLEYAIQNNTPVFCNCRGVQFANVFLGGSLVQSLTKELKNKRHLRKIHLVNVVDEKFYEIIGKRKFEVNSYHDQAITIDRLAKDFRVFALSEEEIVEGIYHKNYPIFGVQWHPERSGGNDNVNQRLIQLFLKLMWERK